MEIYSKRKTIKSMLDKKTLRETYEPNTDIGPDLKRFIGVLRESKEIFEDETMRELVDRTIIILLYY